PLTTRSARNYLFHVPDAPRRCCPPNATMPARSASVIARKPRRSPSRATDEPSATLHNSAAEQTAIVTPQSERPIRLSRACTLTGHPSDGLASRPVPRLQLACAPAKVRGPKSSNEITDTPLAWLSYRRF